MSYCYIIRSEAIGKFYIGVTSDSVEGRLEKHNNGYYGKSKYTSVVDDWELYLSIPTMDYGHSQRVERKIKSMKSSVYIRNLKKYPELLSKILSSTKR